jgi:hypothetical protein
MEWVAHPKNARGKKKTHENKARKSREKVEIKNRRKSAKTRN